MEYNEVLNSFYKYIEQCKEIIKNSFFSEKDLKFLKNDGESDINEIIRNHRLKMIDIKIEHTMRMIEQVIKVNKQLNVKVNLEMIIKVAALYHDIGRFRQATWSNTYNDNEYTKNNEPYLNHGEDGFNIFINNDFKIDSEYRPVIASCILYHVDFKKEPKLQYQFNSDISCINVDNILTGNFNFSELEWQIASLIVQLISDIDKTDILYQHLNDDFEMIRPHIFDKTFISLNDLAKKWEISKEEIIEYNNINEKKYEPQVIKIPIKNVTLDKLEVKGKFKEMFYQNNWPELSLLMKDPDWNFITVLWWRLSHFLSSINFTCILINIEESNLLNNIFNKIPSHLQPLFKEAFNFANEYLLREKIEKNNNMLYLTKTKK